jgi:hypothetical protein
MPRFYIPPEVSKKLMEISGGDFRHPVVERFCHDMVSAQIRAENIAAMKTALIAISVIALIIFITFAIATIS